MKSKSKKLSYILRHSFSENFLAGGWLDVKIALNELKITMAELEDIVSQNDKGRYELSFDKTLVRALYGHSIAVDLDYVPMVPPKTLYHGTAKGSYDSILENGIIRKSRQFVHLSEDATTAMIVGERHGDPIVLDIDAEKMYQDGLVFYNPKDGIWLSDLVKTEYIIKR